MMKSTIAAAANLKRDEKGSVAILFGLSAIAICMFAGLAIDLGRTYSSKAKLEAAIDAASLAAARGMRLEGLSETQAAAVARTVFDENMKGGAANWTDIHEVNISVNATTNTAHIDVRSSVRTTFGAIAGIQRMGSPGAGTAVFESKDYEVTLQLDLTGSMCDIGRRRYSSCTDHPKIQGLKDATKELVDILLPDNRGNDQTIRIAYAPFTAGVNLGAFQSAVTGGVTTADGCVYERKDASIQATDIEPIGVDRFMVAADLRAAPYNVFSPRPCPTARVLPLTDDKTLLKNTVDGYVATGSTGGHNGTAWAWNMISPNFRNVWPSANRPADYNDSRTDKVAILMTDGEYNTMFGDGWDAAQASQKAVETCTAMKAKGIRIYTVGFALDTQLSIDTLAACATHPTDFKRAETPQELTTVFKNIAQNITRLRLTN